jgi:hypothetical protein
MAHWDAVSIVAGGSEVEEEAAAVRRLALCAAPLVLNEYGVSPSPASNCSDGWYRWAGVVARAHSAYLLVKS